jgi:hypothetical protein
MVAVWIVVGLLAVLIIAAVYDTKRRRADLEATLPPGVSRASRRRIIREQRAQDRATRARYTAEHPYLHGGGGDGGGL